MNTDTFVRTLKVAQAARDEAKRRRYRNAEMRKLFTGASLVFAGLFLATIYSLLNHQIPL